MGARSREPRPLAAMNKLSCSREESKVAMELDSKGDVPLYAEAVHDHLSVEDGVIQRQVGVVEG